MVAAGLAFSVLLAVAGASPIPRHPARFWVDARLGGDAEALRRTAEGAWAALERSLIELGLEAPATRPEDIALQVARPGEPHILAFSRPGRVALRPIPRGAFDADWRRGLEHELVHQLLFRACPEASGDRLFHEAVAMASSGEVERWLEGPPLSGARARARLASGVDLDRRDARRALARVLADATHAPRPLPAGLARKLRACGSGARWAPLSVREMAEGAELEAHDAFLVLSRWSGEILESSGDIERPMPFGSTLKPFLVAGAEAAAPRLWARDPAERRDWSCGQDRPGSMDASQALARSCNGYFFDWAEAQPEVAQLGAFGPVLTALGLSHLPEDVEEAIGLRTTLSASAWTLAQAYRLLAASRPDVIVGLEATATTGTLAGLGLARPGLALKTGTVRDETERPRLGWIVAVDADWVMVLARRDRAPRTFAADLARARVRFEGARRRAATPVEVQVFGLHASDAVEVACPGVGIGATARPTRFDRTFQPLSRWVAGGPALCLGRPFQVRVPREGSAEVREYAGQFSSDPAPPPPRTGVPPASAMALRARRGSDVLFRTTLARYVAGVLEAEDAEIRGPARQALGRVIAENAEVRERHAGRPPCDTTHCQAFWGTARPRPEDREIFAAAPMSPPGRWRPFSRGGREPWTAERSAREVEALLGRGARLLAFRSGRAWIEETVPGDPPVEEARALPCEALRGPLKLPACPLRFRRAGASFVFEGEGAGHGEGLDVEAAKARAVRGASAEALLEAAFSEPERPAEERR